MAYALMKDRVKGMSNVFRIALFLGVTFVGLLVLLFVGDWGWRKWSYYLPPESRVREQFEAHRADFVRLAALLEKDHAARFYDQEGVEYISAIKKQSVPECRSLIRAIGAKNVIVREDGSIDFALWGSGGPLASDSYMGIRYAPNNRIMDMRPGYGPTIVSSLESDTLPKEKGAVASGYYAVAIETEWFLYRYEYQE